VSDPSKSWVDFWDGEHAIYVNERHKTLHAQAIARDIIRCIPSADAVVLDYGCGEALYAAAVAACCRRLILCEAADGLRGAVADRMRDIPNVDVLDPAGIERREPGSLGLIVANSLVQYLRRDTLMSLLRLWRWKLKPEGVLLVADVIPPETGTIADAAALLRFGWTGGFLFAALAGLARTALSDYRRTRSCLGFATYSEADFLGLLADAGFQAERMRPNFGHNQRRMSFRARLP
jgi:SAM-dependent methyltransferase